MGSKFLCDLIVHRGAGAYICGEETGLIESLEGKRPNPRIKPPYFPAVLGLYQCPTIVNNVETLCNVKHILEIGGEEFSKIGNIIRYQNMVCLGHVQKAGYYEFECGALTLGEMIYDVCGGLFPDDLCSSYKGGSSSKILRADERFTGKLKDGTDFDGVLRIFRWISMVCTLVVCPVGGIIVMDNSVDMVEAMANINAFYAHESCGQCTPCRKVHFG